MRANPLLLRVIESIAADAGIGKTGVVELLETQGLQEVLKAVAISVEKSGGMQMGGNEAKLLASAGKANLAQAEKTAETTQSWLPKDNFVDDRYGQSGKPAGFTPMSPRTVHTFVEVESGAPKALSVYGKALKATEMLLKTGRLRSSDIRSILGNDTLDASIEKMLVSLDKASEAVDAFMNKFEERQSILDSAAIDVKKAADDLSAAVEKAVSKKRRGA